LLTGALMVTVMLVGMAAFLLMLSGFVNEITPTIPDVMTDIPTLYDYDEDGIKITEISDPRNTVEYKQILAEIKELQLQLDNLGGHGYERDNIQLQIKKLEAELSELYIDVKAERQRLTTELEKLRIELKECKNVCAPIPTEALKHNIIILEDELFDLGYQGLIYPNVRLELYWLFAYPSLVILFIFILSVNFFGKINNCVIYSFSFFVISINKI